MKKSAEQLNNKRSAFLSVSRLSKYAIVLALAVLLFVTTCGLAAGYWIICEQTSTANDMFVYADNGALSHYVQGDETTYNSKEQFPIVSKSTVDGKETLRDLDFTAYDENPTEYFKAFAYSYSTDGESFNEGMPKDAGNYKIKIESKIYTTSGKSKYGVAIVDYVIKPLKLTATLVKQTQSGVYNAAEPTIDGNVTVICTDGSALPSFVNSELDFSASKAAGVDAGEYAITVSASAIGDGKLSNYDITYANGTYTITPAPVTLKAEDKSYTYGDTPSLSYKVTSGTIYSRDTVNVSYKIGNATNYEKVSVGSYALTVEAEAHKNYTFTYESGTATVEARKVDIIWTLPTDLVYDGNKKGLSATYTTVNGDTPNVTVDYSAEPINAGNYTATATINDGNYAISQNATKNFTIAAKVVTVTVSSPITYGEKFVITANDLVGSDTASYTMDGEVYDKDKLYDAGEHSFSADAGSNYNVSYPATVTVNKKTVTATISVTNTEIYDNEPISNAGITVSAEGLVSSDGVKAIITVNGSDYDKTATLNEGTYTISARLSDDKNYNLTVNGKTTLTVKKKVVSDIKEPTVSGTYTYNGTEQTLVLEFNGFDKSLFSISGVTTGTNAGEYTATVSLLDAGATWEDGTNEAKEIKWTIEKAAVTISPKSTTLTYGESFTPSYEVTSGEVYNNDNLSVKYALTGTSGSAITSFQTGLNAGTYALIITNASNDNYNISWSGTASITVGKLKLAKPTAKSDVSYVYNGKAQTFELDKFDTKTMTRNDTTACVNAGTYYITIGLKDTANYAWDDEKTGDINLTFKIAPLKIKFSGIIEVDYNTSGFTLNENLLKTYLVLNSDGTTKVSDYFTDCASGHPTAVFASATASDGNNHTVSLGGTGKVGSTYKVTATATSNYEFTGGGTTYLKYKTAKIDSTYYTIEDAINDTSTTAIILAGGSPYVETWFSGSDCYGTKTFNLSNKDLIVPYKDGVTDSSKENVTESGSHTVYSVLQIPSGVTLDISKKLNITAFVCFIDYSEATITKEHGVVMNNGTINLQSGGSIDACGYLKGKGTVNMESGSTATDLFHMYGFGATLAYALSNAKYFPVDTYTLHNISCKTYINVGATYQAYYLSEADGDALTGTVQIISKENSALFQLKSGRILKYADKAVSSSDTSLDTIEGSNQLKGQRDMIYMENATVVDNSVEIKVKVKSIPANISTSATLACPIPYINVTVGSGSSLTLRSASYKFMPGTVLTVEKGATFNVESGINVTFFRNGEEKYTNISARWGDVEFTPIDKNDATLVVNGTANISGNISGKIVSTEEGATLDISNNNASIVTITSVDLSFSLSPFKLPSAEASSTTMYAFGNVLNSNTTYEETNFTSNKIYYSAVVNDIGVWYCPTSAILSYFSNGGTSINDKTVMINNGGYTIGDDDLPTPTKVGYKFEGWYMDSELNTPAKGQILFTDADVKLYAKWEIVNYTVTYKAVYDGCETTGAFSNGNNPTTANYESNVTLKDAGDGDLKFMGWYSDKSCTNRITAIEKLTADLTVYAKFKANVVTYKINFNLGDNPGSMTLNSLEMEATDSFPTYNDYYNDTSYSYYLVGWYTGNDYLYKVSTVQDLINKLGAEDEYTIYAQWQTKAQLVIEYTSGCSGENSGKTVETGEYYRYDQTITKDAITVKDGYIYLGLDAVSGCTTAISYNGLSATTTVITPSENAAEIKVKTDVRSKYTLKVVKSDDGGTADFSIAYKSGTTSYSKKGDGTSIDVYDGIELTISNITYSKTEEISNSVTIGSSQYTWSSSTTYTINGDVTITISSKNCLVEGTLITLADGSYKKVEDITENDVLLVFNHETGTYDFASVLFNDSEPLSEYTIINLKFSNGKHIKVVSEHGFFDLDLNKYVYIDAINYSDYVGHTFYSATWDGDIYESGTAVLTEAYITQETVRVYSPVTNYHLNYFTEDMLSMPGGISGLFNIFEYDENLKYDEEQKQADIEAYGLFSYDDFKDLVPYEIYAAFPTSYFKVAICKGLLTMEQLNYYIERYSPLMSDL